MDSYKPISTNFSRIFCEFDKYFEPNLLVDKKIDKN